MPRAPFSPLTAVPDVSIDSRSPLGIALVYGVLSGAYILLSDRLVARLFQDPGLTADVQTAKGWLFVVGSAGLIYWLVRRSRGELADINDRLDRALQQTSILHRILRHNLRNSCNVISGNAELLAARADGGVSPDDAEDCLAVIREQTDQLLAITEKTRTLRAVVLDDEPPMDLDLAALVRGRVAAARDRHPEADLRTSIPDRLVVESDPRLADGIDELLDNAVEHSDSDRPVVDVGLRRRPDGAAVLDIADEGPGMPEMERAVLEEGMETPTFHSEGLGLWIARTVCTTVGGKISILDNEPRGTIVRLVLS